MSSIWRATVNAYDIIGSNLKWKVGSGAKIRVGIDPWVRSRDGYLLPRRI